MIVNWQEVWLLLLFNVCFYISLVLANALPQESTVAGVDKIPTLTGLAMQTLVTDGVKVLVYLMLKVTRTPNHIVAENLTIRFMLNVLAPCLCATWLTVCDPCTFWITSSALSMNELGLDFFLEGD